MRRFRRVTGAVTLNKAFGAYCSDRQYAPKENRGLEEIAVRLSEFQGGLGGLGGFRVPRWLRCV